MELAIYGPAVLAVCGNVWYGAFWILLVGLYIYISMLVFVDIIL